MRCPTCGKAMLTERPHRHAMTAPTSGATPRPPFADDDEQHAALLAALRALVEDPFSFATDPDGDCFLCGDPTGGDPDQAEHDAESPDCAAAKARALLADLDGGAAEAGEALGLNMAALREAFHATRWCKDGARGHAFAHGDDPEDIDARGQFLAAYLAAQRDAEAER